MMTLRTRKMMTMTKQLSWLNWRRSRRSGLKSKNAKSDIFSDCRVSEHFTNSIHLVFRASEFYLVMFNKFFSWFILGARAKGRGREDPHGEYLERKSIN